MPIDKLVEMKEITGTLELRSGLHVGVGRDHIEIGGIDLPVIKDAITELPYIPGSSIKGKLRSLLEWKLGCVEDDGSVWGSRSMADPVADPILRIFGTTHKEWKGGPTRLICRDAVLDSAWVDDVVGRGLLLTEEKMEVSIDRLAGKARDGGLRKTERVPAGARFPFEMTYRVFSVDGDGGAKDREILNHLFTALKMLELDALGGSGSRGYGRVRVRDLELDGASIQERFDAITFDQTPAVVGA
ncbi:MAG: type III-A CRISPR-associated RAMP protein Csm3 [Nitrospirae bacterium]|nr:MAG: type III-A CRISPR-associated RAMP protein Csm3 [Nitrospirota bacterium]